MIVMNSLDTGNNTANNNTDVTSIHSGSATSTVAITQTANTNTIK